MQTVKNLGAVFSACLPGQVTATPRDHALWVGVARLRDWQPWQHQAAELLDDSERDRAMRKRRPVDQEALVLCYALHRLFVAAWMGVDAAEVPLGRDGEGRPVVRGSGLSTSLSHAEQAVAFAVCAGGSVGVDIEGEHRASTLEEIADRICHPLELLAMTDLSAPARHVELLKLWVRKEAYLKAVGVGLAWEMSSFAASADALLPLHEGRTGRVMLSEISALPGHTIAAAGPGDARIVPFLLEPGQSG